MILSERPAPVRRDLDSASSGIAHGPEHPLLPPEIDPSRDQRPDGFLQQQTLKKATAVIRSKSKTERLIELCDQATGSTGKSDDWVEKCEKFFQSPVWKLVSDEALRKARFQCECWGCSGRATQVQLLEFPAEHLEPGFDWMNRNGILISLCSHHFEIAHRAVMMKPLTLDQQDRQFESGVFGHRGATGSASIR